MSVTVGITPVQRVREWRIKNPDKYKAQCKRLRINMSPEKKAARAVYMRIYRSSNPEKRKLWYLNGNLKRGGSNLQHYEKLYSEQEGKCKICGEWQARLVVDHCHSEKKFRGLLCPRCNLGIGHFRDDPKLLVEAALYLCP